MPDDSGGIPEVEGLEAGHGNSGVEKRRRQGAPRAKTVDVGLPAIAGESDDQLDERPFRPADVELGDREGDADGVHDRDLGVECEGKLTDTAATCRALRVGNLLGCVGGAPSVRLTPVLRFRTQTYGKVMDDFTRLETYDYELPSELIAQHPCNPRDAARLLVVDRRLGTWRHHTIRELPDLLQPRDCLVLNDSRVVPARLIGRRSKTGGRWEGLFLGLVAGGKWRLIGQTRGHLRPGESVTIPAVDGSPVSLELRFEERLTGGAWIVSPQTAEDVVTILERHGHVPLPPYIRQGQETAGDRESYQTVYAAQPGSAAAPTAGLHFTPELLARCAERGLETARVTLHVGLGTFRPVASSDIREHIMHAEWCRVPGEAAQQLATTRAAGGRVVAVGTTSLRTLETAVPQVGWQPWEGESQLFVYPPYRFQAVDVLLTNFHLPKSTLLMLVSAFGGYELIREAYAAAIAERYRFFSYGDAMLIL